LYTFIRKVQSALLRKRGKQLCGSENESASASEEKKKGREWPIPILNSNSGLNLNFFLTALVMNVSFIP